MKHLSDLNLFKRQFFVLQIIVSLFSLVLLLYSNCFAQNLKEDDFVVKPYLQLGNNSKLSNPEQMELLWFTKNKDDWHVETKSSGLQDWHTEESPSSSTVLTPQPLFLFRAKISHLKPGATFEYRLLKNGEKVFQAKGLARKSFNEPYKVVLFGDTGANTPSERKIAWLTNATKPDLVIILGDIVYNFGLFSEYIRNFFPIYNCDASALQFGAPLTRSILTIGVIGNHDVALGANARGVDLNKLPDALSYFNIWSEPLDGPPLNQIGSSFPKLFGSPAQINQYRQGTQDRYPSMSNYSFDYGNSHWLVLDANPYMNWGNQALRNWVSKDLASANNTKWKFVCFHQPGFSIDASHYKEQRMRLLCDLFEKGGVDVVFSGHAHDYQRSFPLSFRIKQSNGHPVINGDGTIDGAFVLDKNFDRVKNTSPKGVVYIVSGGGGATLYGSLQERAPWVENIFTDKFISNTHSYTLCDINDSTLKLSQISEDGHVLDRITLKK